MKSQFMNFAERSINNLELNFAERAKKRENLYP